MFTIRNSPAPNPRDIVRKPTPRSVFEHTNFDPPRETINPTRTDGYHATITRYNQVMAGARHHNAFTLIELLVSTAVIGLLISILLPALSAARQMAKSTVCLTRLRTAGQGLALYANDFKDVLPPSRMPKIDDNNWRVEVIGGVKYRPTFLTMMERQIGLRPFDDPKPSKNEVDRFGQPGDRQNYASEMYVCPEVPHWTDERNAAFGYNYQFLGNARLLDDNNLNSYKNWPVQSSWIQSPAQCVAVADSLGTAASFSPRERGEYQDNDLGDSRSGRSLFARGNEGFNFDPPRIDQERGEAASLKHGHIGRTALHERHRGRGTVLWVDGHASGETNESLGYEIDEDGVVGLMGDNRLFSSRGENKAWTE